jgi:hypothetical protein
MRFNIQKLLNMKQNCSTLNQPITYVTGGRMQAYDKSGIGM